MDEVLAVNPKNVKAFVEKGFLYFHVFEDVDNTIKCFEQALKLEPRNVDALFWFSEAQYHLIAEMFQAIDMLTLALSIDDKRADCHSLLSDIVCYIEDDVERAVKHLEIAIKLEPFWPFLKVKLISKFMAQGRLDEAEDLAYYVQSHPEEIEIASDASIMEEYIEFYITGRTMELDKSMKFKIEKINKMRAGRGK
ncbi:tetratricopeptide repeat protein [Candidatus Dependentiae bacterium]